MNRGRRIIALLENKNNWNEAETPDIGFQSTESSLAPTEHEAYEALRDINIESELEEDDSFRDPDFIISPCDNESTDSNCSSDIERECQLKAPKSDGINIMQDINLRILDVPTSLTSVSSENKVFNPIFSSVGTITKKKRTCCKFCLTDVTNFERHLERNHTDCQEVVNMLSYPKKHPERKNILSLIRNSGHFNEFLKGNIRPKYGTEANNKEYYPCHRCKAMLSKNYLYRHKKKCIVLKKSKEHTDKFSNEAAASQTMIACSLDENNTIHKLRVKKEVFSRMKADDISITAKTDYLISMFGENYLKKHKRDQLATVCSNKMRELARFLLEFRKISNKPYCTLQDTLLPKLFDTAIECAKRLGGYDVDKKTYRSPSLSAHLGTSLKQVCELFTRLLLKEDFSIKVIDREQALKDTTRFKELIETQWTIEINSLALKNLMERRWEKPIILPLTSDVIKFKEYVSSVADKALNILQCEPNNKKEFKNLVEACLTLTILFNRRRIGDVQYTYLKTYTSYVAPINQEECESALSESEKILTKHYKRLVTGGKGSRAIAILFHRQLQVYIDFFVKIRMDSELVPKNNQYLFGCPGTTKWTRGDVVIRRFAEKAGIKDPTQISSNKLRKQIATVMQILNLSNEELDQFTQFMGHTDKTHNEFYKLPQDIYQTAKVSKLLLLMEKGAEKYKGKSLNEIDINPEQEYAEEDSDKEHDAELSFKLLPSKSCVKDERNDNSKQKITGRTRWSGEQVKLLKVHFKKHIREQKAPKKQECLDLLQQHPYLLQNKDWVRIKTFIYNCYRKK